MTENTAPVNIEKLSQEGRGIAFIQGKITFIKGALPGETVQLRLSKKHRRYDEAKATEILTASPLRVLPRCKVFEICGGCALQHFDAQAQIAAKQEALAEKLRQAKISTSEWLLPLQAEIWGYRHKARLGVQFVRKKNATLIGFREAETNSLTDTDICEVLHPSIGQHLAFLKASLNNLSIRAEIPQIEIAVDETCTALIIRHLVPIPTEDLSKLELLYQQTGWVLFLQPAGLDSITQLFPAEQVDLKYTVYSLRGQEIKIHFQPADFTQINFSLNAKMIKQALELLNIQPNQTILDLFCGLGNFTLPIATQAAKVIAVEGDPAIVERARVNAAKQGFNNIEFYTSNLFDLHAAEPFYTAVDQLFLDPPRTGAEAVVRNIEKWQPRRIVYVSCDPATLVRDLAILVHEKNYKLVKIGVMDMFPHTRHVESMALLELA